MDKKNLAETASGVETGYGFDSNTANELQEYKRILSDTYQELFGVTIGSVVMNANPFTLGHRYLIEEALKQCDYLVIFVVQEDRSDFSFDERLRMVDDGTRDLENVLVVPSGRFIISSLTFEEYFNKSSLQERVIDPSLDVSVFAKEIAPCMNITKRFVGEEPLDTVTRQYNESMAKILPEYGIEFVEIKRCSAAGEMISASRVRELWEKGETGELLKFVPQTTYDYLVKK